MDVLAGLDDVPWESLDHCFGISDDIPALLGETADGSREALDTLSEYMVHQGTLYEATPYLVRFLARIAVSGVLSADILDLLGVVADCDNAHQDPGVRGRTRAALAAEIAILVPLLDDSCEQVREAAAWALPQTMAADRLVEPLLERMDRESSPLVAASVLRGLSFLDPEGAGQVAANLLADEDSRIRLMAAWACAEAGRSWSADLREAALAWTADGALMKGFRWTGWTGHPFSDLLATLAAAGNPAAAVELVTIALGRPITPEVRGVVMLAASYLAEVSRSAAPRLIAPLIPVITGDDAESSVSAIVQLREQDALAGAADELAATADVEGSSHRADWALACLVQTGDPRWVPLLVRDQRHRPLAVDVLRRIGTCQFSTALLDGVRSCLRDELLGQRWTPCLIALIGSWGPAARPAVPDLLRILSGHEAAVGRAVADICGATAEAIGLLRQAGANLTAALKLHELTGEGEPLFIAVQSGLTETGHGLRRAVGAARTLTPDERLIPLLTDALAASSPSREKDLRTQLALALWHHSGDPAPALEIIADRIRADAARHYFGPGAAGAARAAAVMGSAAAPMISMIVPLLDSAAACPAAVRALRSIDPVNCGGIALSTLAGHLLTPFGQAISIVQLEAVQVLGEIGVQRLPDHVIARLRELAAQDGRIVQSGLVQAFIRDDDKLRTAIGELVEPARKQALRPAR